METENSRRSAMDRSSRDISKKPRLGEPSESASSSVSAALARGVHELVAQYRAALAELTFNSKPIITNLTIIAGENLHAAKGIATAICSQILEVPSDQKLPSLYLLDSIVKNIGREYIKYFAAKLPEVFCEAYKQVDPSVHNGMRHLFGTWKGVFPPSALQVIEKELGFQKVINGSSLSAASKPDSQIQATQRQAHSIHVNPKYLEARQRLQQSTRAKESGSDDDGSMNAEDEERLERKGTTANTRQWTDTSSRIPTIQRPQREHMENTSHEKKQVGNVNGREFSSVVSRLPDHGVRRIGEKTTDRDRDEPDKSYYLTRSPASGAVAPRRNDINAVNAYDTYRSSGLARPDSRTSSVQLKNTNKAERPIVDNWKNSEEEEYMWEDMSSNSKDYGGTNSTAKRSWKTEQPDLPNTFTRQKTSGGEDRVPSFRDVSKHQPVSHSRKPTDPRRKLESTTDQLALERVASGKQTSSMWPQRGSLSASDLNQMSRRVSSQPDDGVSYAGGIATGSSGLFGQQRLQLSQPPSPPAHSPPSYIPSQYQTSRSSVDHDRPLLPSSQMVQNPRHISGHLGKLASVSQDPRHVSHNLQPPLPSSQPSARFAPSRQQISTLHQSESDIPPNHSPSLSQSSGTEGNNTADTSGKSNASSLLAAIMQTGLISNNLSSGLPNFTTQPPLPSRPPPLPSGPPPVQLLSSSGPSITQSPNMLQTCQDDTLNVVPPVKGSALPPLPPGPPPSSSGKPNHLTDLLSSLVAKGLISSKPTETTTVTPSPVLHKIQDQNSRAVPAVSATLPIRPTSVKENPVISKPSAPLVASSKVSTDLIGVNFKPEIIRQVHTSVINSLFEDLVHVCDACGLRFKHEEQLCVHLDLHESKNSKLNSSDRMSRRWYKSIRDLAVSSLGTPEMPDTTNYVEELEPISEDCGPMVPADETQSICTLCGEPFEDLYSHERDEWMYKGAMYLDPKQEGDSESMDRNIEQILIAHDKCISSSGDNNMEVGS